MFKSYTRTTAHVNWYNQEVTDGQLDKARVLVYKYKIVIEVPLKCGEMSKKLSKIEKAIAEGRVKPRNAKRGYGYVDYTSFGRPRRVYYAEPKFEHVKETSANEVTTSEVASTSDTKDVTTYTYTCAKCGKEYTTTTRTHFKKDRICAECK